MVDKSPEAFRNISEVSKQLDVPAHVLRFWETRFSQIKPVKRSGGRRYYRPEDIKLLTRIRDLLYREGYTIKGAQQVLKSGPAAAEAAVEPVETQTESQHTSLNQAVSLLKQASDRLAQLEQAI